MQFELLLTPSQQGLAVRRPHEMMPMPQTQQHQPRQRARLPMAALPPSAMEPFSRVAVGIRGASHAHGLATAMLADFAAAGVDEDLEMLRSQWQAPRQFRGRSRDDDSSGGRNVQGGALDYKSAERLETLTALRELAAAETRDGGRLGGAGALAVYEAPSRVPREASCEAWLPQRTALEQRVRAQHPPAERDGPGLDWGEWEARWEEQLRGFAAFSSANSAFSSASHPERDPYATPQHATPWRARTAEPRSRSPRPSASSASSSAAGRGPKPSPKQASKRGAGAAAGGGGSGGGTPRQPRAKRASTPPPRPPRPPPSSAPPGASSSASAASASAASVGRRFASWSGFDAAFAAFEANLANVPAGLPSVRLADIPFPPRGDPAGLSEAGVRSGNSEEAASGRKKLLRKALLRWHPDKWGAVLGKVREEDKARLGEELAAITQALIREKDRA